MKTGESELLKGLNQKQREAVTFANGPLLIVAGAGTGKTTVITRRIAWLVEQGLAKPEEILALTFTEKAAGEMEERVDRLLPYGYLDLWISTFHAFCQRILESHALDIGLPVNFRLLTQTEQWILIRENLEKFELDYYRPLGNPSRFIHALLSHFSRAKDEMISSEDYLAYADELRLDLDEKKSADDERSQEALRAGEVANAYKVYQDLLLSKNALDFGDLISYVITLFKKRPKILAAYRRKFKYLLVDEFQDTNYAQYELVKLLAGETANITVVGDDDQSIYKFRGASVSNILKFKDHFKAAREITLIENYRSMQNLLDKAYFFIKKNSPDRLEDKLKISKKLISTRPGQGLADFRLYEDFHQEARAVAERIIELKNRDPEATWNDFAVLVRANDTSEPFLDAFESAGIPFMQLSRKGLYRKPVIVDLLAYLRLLDNYHESKALFRVLNFSLFDLSHDDIAGILNFSSRKTYSVYEAIKRPELQAGLSEKGRRSVAKLLSLIEKHSGIARAKPVTELYVAVVTDLKLGIYPADERRQEYDLGVLDQFNRKIQDFSAQNEHKRLKNFMEMIEMELASGESGELQLDPDVGPEMVKIITVHSAKGLEYRYVFIPALADKKFPAVARAEPIELPEKLIREILPEGDVHLQEERRLFYVAMTRARDGLFLSYARDYGGSTVRKPSVFLKELEILPQNEITAAPTGKVVLKNAPAKKKKTLPAPKSYSFSSISSFLKCPLEYKYVYLLKLPVAGSGALSFGQTIHRTLENFLRDFQQKNAANQGDLFVKNARAESREILPPFQKLQEYYNEAWVDDWFESKFQKDRYRNRGLEILKLVYDKFAISVPAPLYLEKPFRLGLEGRVFTGKLDRADKTGDGLVIIDYKTGSHRPLGKVDKDQLLIYQWAAQEFLREKVSALQYWFFNREVVVENFIGDERLISEVKLRLLDAIKKIEDAVLNDGFAGYHKKHQGCEFEHFK